MLAFYYNIRPQSGRCSHASDPQHLIMVVTITEGLNPEAGHRRWLGSNGCSWFFAPQVPSVACDMSEMEGQRQIFWPSSQMRQVGLQQCSWLSRPYAAGRYGAAFCSFLAYFVRKLHEHKSSISRRHWLMLIRKPYSKGN